MPSPPGWAAPRIHYAVKANPAPEILERLVAEGARFDAASRAEIAACLAGRRPPAATISFSATHDQKKNRPIIAWAWDRGVTLFAADAEAELDKIAEHGPPGAPRGGGAPAGLYPPAGHRQPGPTGPAEPQVRLAITTPRWRCWDHSPLTCSLDPVGPCRSNVGLADRQAAMWDAPAGRRCPRNRTWTRRPRAPANDLKRALNLGGGFPAF